MMAEYRGVGGAAARRQGSDAHSTNGREAHSPSATHGAQDDRCHAELDIHQRQCLLSLGS
jgi:hypothetical protein